MKIVLKRETKNTLVRTEAFMTTEDSIIQIFCLVDDEMKGMPKHSQAKLYPRELVLVM